jgi:hypothetical protein
MQIISLVMPTIMRAQIDIQSLPLYFMFEVMVDDASNAPAI